MSHCHLAPAGTLLLLVLTGSAVHAQTPLRDGQRITTGTSMIAGTIVTDERDPRPVRRARVMINSADRTVGRTVVTDDAGTFAITDLPAGRYVLTSTKDGHLTVTYGARRLGRPGTPIVLEDGQRMTDLVLRIPRGAVITGTVLDENGQPLPGVSVQAARSVVRTGERQFVPGGSPQTTDDRGVYRIYGLMPGEYIVSASGALGHAPPGPEVHIVTDADIRRALNEVRAPYMSTRPGQPAQTELAAPPSGESTTVAYAPIYYPGVMLADQATRFQLSPGEERGGIDLQMQLVRTAKIEGTVVTPAGVSPQVPVMMVLNGGATVSFGSHFRSTRADTEGRFSFSSVSPGRYSIVARGGAVPQQRQGQPAGPFQSAPPPYWGQSDVVVDGRDMSDVLLALQPGLTVSGTIRFEATTLTAPEDLSRIRVTLAGSQSQGEVRLGAAPAQVNADGRFAITGVTPARYRVQASVPSASGTPEWYLKSAQVDGRDVLDTALDLQSTRAPGEIVLTFTDRPTILSGTVQDAAGRPAPDYHIIAFTTDRTMWGPQSRRIASIRPSADGRYTFRAIPPGEYFVAAVDDVEQDEWFDPAFLQALVEASIKVTIAEGEQKTQDLRLASSR